VTRVRYVQTGGFAGLKLTADLDTSDLPPDEATALDQLVDAALAEGPPPPPDPRARDDQQYEVTIDRDGEHTVLRGTDPHLSPAFAALVADLRPRAEPSR
jgi:hypothetical protein